jgi:ribosome-binding factor A
VASVIRSVVAQAILTRLNDPRIPTITSITEVEVSDDLTLARLHISVMAPEPQRQLCLTALQSATGFLRRLLGPALQLRLIPRLEFRLDESLRRSFDTIAAIDNAMRELGAGPAWEHEEGEQAEGPDSPADAVPGAAVPDPAAPTDPQEEPDR